MVNWRVCGGTRSVNNFFLLLLLLFLGETLIRTKRSMLMIQFVPFELLHIFCSHTKPMFNGKRVKPNNNKCLPAPSKIYWTLFNIWSFVFSNPIVFFLYLFYPFFFIPKNFHLDQLVIINCSMMNIYVWHYDHHDDSETTKTTTMM